MLAKRIRLCWACLEVSWPKLLDKWSNMVCAGFVQDSVLGSGMVDHAAQQGLAQKHCKTSEFLPSNEFFQ